MTDNTDLIAAVIQARRDARSLIKYQRLLKGIKRTYFERHPDSRMSDWSRDVMDPVEEQDGQLVLRG